MNIMDLIRQGGGPGAFGLYGGRAPVTPFADDSDPNVADPMTTGSVQPAPTPDAPPTGVMPEFSGLLRGRTMPGASGAPDGAGLLSGSSPTPFGPIATGFPLQERPFAKGARTATPFGAPAVDDEEEDAPVPPVRPGASTPAGPAAAPFSLKPAAQGGVGPDMPGASRTGMGSLPAASGASTGASPAAPASGPSWLNKLSDSGGWDQLSAFGFALAGGKNWGDGFSRGGEAMQKQSLVAGLNADKRQKAAQERNTLAANAALYRARVNPNATDQEALAAGANSTIMTDVLKRGLPQAAPEGFRLKADGTGVEPIPGGPQDPATKKVGAQAQAEGTAAGQPDKDAWAQVDVRQPDGSVQTQWVKKGEGNGVAIGAPVPAVAPPTDEQRRAFNIPANAPAKMTPKGPEMIGGAPGATIEAQAAQRRATVAGMGMNPDDERNRDYILTGRLSKQDQQPLTAADKRAIQEGEDSVLSHKNTLTQLNRALELSKKAYDGAGASQRAMITSNVPAFLGGHSPESLATREFDNVVTGQALDNLKATFGGAPTEGERAILLQVQGSANQPQALREQIINNAMAKVQQKLDFEQGRVNELRGGTYYKPRAADGTSPAPTAGSAPAPRTDAADPGSGSAAPATSPVQTQPQRLAQPRSKADLDSLPSGTPFIAPDGSIRRKP